MGTSPSNVGLEYSITNQFSYHLTVRVRVMSLLVRVGGGEGEPLNFTAADNIYSWPYYVTVR